jgi:hypothetical protein
VKYAIFTDLVSRTMKINKSASATTRAAERIKNQAEMGLEV